MDRSGNTKAVEKEYQDIMEFIKEITALCGMENIEETALGLDEKEYGRYRNLIKELIWAIVEIVKLQEKSIDFEPFLTELPDEEFWHDIEKRVEHLTDKFKIVAPYRKLELEKRQELLKKAFYIIYVERENKSYLEGEIGDVILSNALYEILLGSEYTIVNMYVSKRRFKEYLYDIIRLEDSDLEYIWNMYEQNFSDISAYVSMKCQSRIERKINELTRRIDELEEHLADGFDE